MREVRERGRVALEAHAARARGRGGQQTGEEAHQVLGAGLDREVGGRLVREEAKALRTAREAEALARDAELVAARRRRAGRREGGQREPQPVRLEVVALARRPEPAEPPARE